jgi:hypothetical protein
VDNEASPQSLLVLAQEPQEEINGTEGEEDDHGIHSCFLAIPDIKGRKTKPKSTDQPRFSAKAQAADFVNQGDGQDAKNGGR